MLAGVPRSQSTGLGSCQAPPGIQLDTRISSSRVLLGLDRGGDLHFEQIGDSLECFSNWQLFTVISAGVVSSSEIREIMESIGTSFFFELFVSMRSVFMGFQAA